MVDMRQQLAHMARPSGWGQHTGGLLVFRQRIDLKRILISFCMFLSSMRESIKVIY